MRQSGKLAAAATEAAPMQKTMPFSALIREASDPSTIL